MGCTVETKQQYGCSVCFCTCLHIYSAYIKQICIYKQAYTVHGREHFSITSHSISFTLVSFSVSWVSTFTPHFYTLFLFFFAFLSPNPYARKSTMYKHVLSSTSLPFTAETKLIVDSVPHFLSLYMLCSHFQLVYRASIPPFLLILPLLLPNPFICLTSSSCFSSPQFLYLNVPPLGWLTLPSSWSLSLYLPVSLSLVSACVNINRWIIKTSHPSINANTAIKIRKNSSIVPQ